MFPYKGAKIVKDILQVLCNFSRIIS